MQEDQDPVWAAVRHKEAQEGVPLTPWRQKDEEIVEDMDYESGSNKELLSCERQLEDIGCEEHKEMQSQRLAHHEEEEDEALEYDEEMEEDQMFAHEYGEDEMSEMGISEPSRDVHNEGGS